MGEVENLSKEDVLEIIKTFPLKPYSNRIIVTTNKEVEDGEMITSDNILAEEQFVVAVGPMAERTTQPGDKVKLDLKKLTVRDRVDYDQAQVSTRIEIDPIEHEGVIYAMINDNQLKAKYI